MSKGFVVEDLSGDPSAILPLEVTEHILVSLLACAQYYELYCILAELIHYICDQIESLLVSQAGNDTDEHSIRIDIETELFLKSCLILDLLCLEIIRVIVDGNERIFLRIPVFIVNTVHDTAQVILACAHESVESFAIIRHLNFFGICLGNCRNGVCIYETALEHIRIAVELKLIRCEVVVRKTNDILHGLDIPYALEFQVMDRHDGLDSAIELIGLECVIQINRNEACLPVMAVDDVRTEFNRRKNRKSSFAEECKASDIIRHACIRLVAGEEILIIDKIEVDAVQFALHDAYIVAVPVKIHVEMCLVLQHVFALLVHERIHRQDDSAVEISFVNALRKRSDNVCKTTGLNERHYL